jgi:hypothetical protein
MITYNNPDIINTVEVKRFFTDKNASGFYEWHDWSAEKGLERLVFGITKDPKNLQAHLERIYYCFQEQLNEQLFGALIDLLIILNKSGKALAKRMLIGSRSRLSENQIKTLADLFENKDGISEFVFYTSCSIFSKGLESTSALIRLAQDTKHEVQDPLVLARNYVEYNQLDNAIHVLEEAILDDPERKELQIDLLSLYQSTLNQTGFLRFYDELARKKLAFPQEWDQLNNFFTGLNNVEK